jgi:hypothetical protein
MDIRDKFYTAINATPLSEKGKERLKALGFDVSSNNLNNLRNFFYEKIYVPPFSTSNEMIGAFKENSDETLVFGKDEEHFQIRQKRKIDFETDVKNNKEAVFMIIGPAGSGKTTYLNWLFDKELNRTNQQKLIIIDIENKTEVRKVVRFCDDDYDIKNKFNTLSGRLSSAILCKINKCIMRLPAENIKEYKKRLLNICENYEKIFRFIDAPGESPLIKELFALIKEYSCNVQTAVNFTRSIFTIIDKIEISNDKEKIDLYFQILIKILLCQLSCKISLDIKSYVIAIDNIERLIDEDNNEAIIIQENDLKDFVIAIKKTIEAIDGILNVNGYSLKNKLSIILSLRDTTIKLVSSRQNIDDGNYPLNIKDWNDAQKIYNNKCKNYLSKEDIKSIDDDLICKTFNYIMEDKKRGSGLYYIIMNMYNHDLRRIIDAIKHIISLPLNANVVLKDYILWWNYSSDDEADNTEKTIIKFLCRKAVLRLFYNLFEHQGVFTRLGTGNSSQLETKASYARKILSFLYQQNPKELYDEQENYFNLHLLVCNVLRPSNTAGYNGINDSEFINFADILFQMIDITMLPNFWSPLISLILHNRIETEPKAIYEII